MKKKKKSKTNNSKNGLDTIIYFGWTADDKSTDNPSNLRIKIGKTKDLAVRTDQHQKDALAYGGVYKEVCALWGLPSDERALLNYFRDIEYRGRENEWFCPERKLIEYLYWLRSKGFVWVPKKEEEEKKHYIPIEDQEPHDSGEWLPNEENRKKLPKPKMSLIDDWEPLGLPPRSIMDGDFYTNEIIIKAATKLYGTIDLDPASCVKANTVVNARVFYTMNDSGLEHKWFGNVWLNPPFSDWKNWSHKLFEELKRGDVKQLCIFSSTLTLSSQYYTSVLKGAQAMFITEGRPSCWGTKACASSAPYGYAVCYFGPNKEKFRECFSKLGPVYYNPEPKLPR